LTEPVFVGYIGLYSAINEVFLEDHKMTQLIKGTMVLSCLAMMACNNGDTDTDTDDVVECNIKQVDVFPAPDEARAYYRTSVEANFKPEKDDNATIAVADSSGTAVAGTSSWRNNSLVFAPDAPLAPSTEYSTTLDYTCGNGETKQIVASWTTSEVGAATDATALVGKSYVLDLANARFVEPEGIGALLSQYLTVDVLVGIESTDAGEIKMIGAIAEDGSEPPAQATCDPTIDFPVADFSESPFFAVSGDSFEISVDEFTVTLEDFALSGSFSPAGDYIDGVNLQGSIDTRPLVPLMGDETSGDDAICVLAGSLGINCIPCSDGTGDFCLSLVADSISAPEGEGPLTKIEDPCALEACSEEPECQEE
jgi:hypothetical protein